jgi:dihydropyrimidinase
MERLARRVPAEAIADVILHACAWPPTSDVIQAVPALAASGQPSFKVFMTEADFGTRLNDVARLIEAARDAGVVTMVHCEDAAILSRTVRALTEEGRTSLRDFGASRPVSAEIAATEQMSAICISLRAPVYAVHVSSGRAMDVCRQTRKSGAPLFVETRPVFLHLTDERLRGADAALHTTWPTLRPSSDRQQLWRALADGTVDTLGSDHVAVTRAQKLDPSLTITNSRPGMSDLQFMLPMLYSEGVRERRLTLQRFVAATSTNAARIFGLYPRKGVIQEGSDADIVLWDPDRRATVTAAADFSKAGYSVYEGWRVTGWPVMTIRRGEVVFESGRVTGRAGTGQLLSRSRWRP